MCGDWDVLDNPRKDGHMLGIIMAAKHLSRTIHAGMTRRLLLESAGFAGVLLGAALAGPGAFGATYYVAKDNPDAAEPYDTPETAAADIATAVAQATQSGDEVVVDDGTYRFDSTLWITNTITLRSANGRATTFIEPADGFVNSRFIMVSNANTSVSVANTAIVKGFTFRNMLATNVSGAAVWIEFPGGKLQDSRITGCRLYGNSGTAGGVVHLSIGGYVQRCEITGNKTYTTSTLSTKAFPIGGILMTQSTATSIKGGPGVENTLIAGNNGCGIFYGNVTYSGPVINHFTIVDNGSFSALSHSRESTFRNTIFLCATAMPMAERASVSAAVANRSVTPYYNCFLPGIAYDDAGKAAVTDCITAIDAMFVNPRKGDYHLKAGSPCIDKGLAYPGIDTLDAEGNTRTRGDAPDIGCYEYDPDYTPEEDIYYVKPGGSDGNDGRSEATAFATIGAALSRAADGAEIRVAAGTYEISEQLNVTNAVRLVGAGRDTTIVRAAATGFRILRVDNVLALVEGFTFRDASMSTAPSGSSYSYGGVGVLINVGGTVQDCRITGNRLTSNATCNGVAALIVYGYLNRCVIDDNTSLAAYPRTVVEADAYRIYSGVLDYERGVIDNCLVYTNRGSSAVYLNRGSGSGDGGLIRNSTVVMNDATAAINRGQYGSTVQNCILRDRTNGTSRAWANFKRTERACASSSGKVKEDS